MTEGKGIYLSVQRSFPRGASWRTDMRPVNLVQRPAIRSFTRETFPRLGPPPAASVRLTSPRLRRGSLYRIATGMLVPAGMSFVSQ